MVRLGERRLAARAILPTTDGRSGVRYHDERRDLSQAVSLRLGVEAEPRELEEDQQVVQPIKVAHYEAPTIRSACSSTPVVSGAWSCRARIGLRPEEIAPEAHDRLNHLSHQPIIGF
jgi:hypothetical protein